MFAVTTPATLGRRTCAVLAAASAALHGVMLGHAANPAIAVLMAAMIGACLYCARELWLAGHCGRGDRRGDEPRDGRASLTGPACIAHVRSGRATVVAAVDHHGAGDGAALYVRSGALAARRAAVINAPALSNIRFWPQPDQR